jgi:hypothetical protein
LGLCLLRNRDLLENRLTPFRLPFIPMTGVGHSADEEERLA